MTQEVSLQETMQNAIEHQLDNIHTAIPAIVVRADLVNSVVDVQPVINFKAYDGTFQERPTILNVPLEFPASKKSAFTFPVESGDTVMLVFSQRGLDVWKRSNGYPVTPSDFRTFDIKDAVAIPGCMPFGMSINNPSKRSLSHSVDDAVVAHNIGGTEVEIRLRADGSIGITTSNKPIDITGSVITLNAATLNLNANTMNVNVGNTNWIGNISQSGNYTMNGVATFNGVIFNTHIHGTSPGPSNP